MKEKLYQPTYQDKPVDRISDRPGNNYTGIGNKELSKEAIKLPAVEVQNEVIWVNKDVESPFDIKKGESNRLGMFLTPKPKIKSETDSSYSLEMKVDHHRSGILGRVVFRDVQGRLYRDVDLKGIGYSGSFSHPFLEIQDNNVEVLTPTIGEDSLYPGGKKSLGILDRAYAENDIKMAGKFLKAGIRTYRPIALIKIEEIIDKNGNKLSIGVAKSWGLVKRGDEPVVEVRAFGTRSRIQDLHNMPGQENALLDDAMRLIAEEAGFNPENFSRHRYIDWFVEKMALSVARMHAKNWIHGYLIDHNITLDARIIDLDSVETVKEVNDRKRAGETPDKSFDNDVMDAIIATSHLNGILEQIEHTGTKNSEDNISSTYIHDHYYTYHKDTAVIFKKIYQAELEKLKKDSKNK